MSFAPEALLGRVTVADGAWSTQLHARGLPADVVAETANVTDAARVATLACEYVAAGARVLTSNTFCGNRHALRRRGVKLGVAEINRAGAQIAREAAETGDKVLVVGSIGPSGAILAVREIAEDELTRGFAEQATALADAGVDALLLETFSEPAEILLALRAVRDATGLPVIASMSFDSGPQRTRTMMGAEAGQCAAALDDAGADLVGCNCGRGIADVLPAVVALRAATQRPLWVKPNAGLPELQDGRPVYVQTPDEFAAHVATLIDAGAAVLGGCCGAGPEHIRRVAAVVQRHERETKHPRGTA